MSKIQDQALRIGTQIAVYEIKELLDSNQSEIIYRAWSDRLNTMVLIKEFFPFEYVSREKDNQTVLPNSKVSEFVFEFGLGDFIKLNEKLLEIQHHGAQTAHNILELNQTAYLVLDVPKGSLLSEHLGNSEAYKEDELKSLASSLLDTLNEFHNADIVHGDIHPTNILIKEDGKPMLLNFSSARQKFARYIENPESELHSGYAAPEQYQMRGSIEPSADLYSLAAVLYRCISGVDPENGVTRLSELNRDNPDSVKSIKNRSDSDLSSEFLVTVDWMFQPEIKARPQSIGEVIPSLSEAESSSKDAAGFFPRARNLLIHAVEDLGSKAKSFGLITIALSIFVSAVLGMVLSSWFLGHDEKRQDLVASGEPASQKRSAFGKAVNSMSKQTVSNQSVPNVSEKSADSVDSNSEKSQQQGKNNSKQIDEFMAKAEESFEKFHLTTPAEKNAYFYYLQVLEIEPDHEGAKKGAENIFDQYVSLIKRAISADDKPLAKIYLDRIKELFPGTPSQKKATDHFDEVLQGISP